MDGKNRQNSFMQIGVLATVPFVLAAPPILGWLLGSFLDEKLETAPYLTCFFIFLGIAAGFKEMYRIIKRFSNEP